MRMTSHKFRIALSRIPLSQVRAAHILGVSPRTVRRWALDQAKVTPTAAKLLRLMAKGIVTVQQVKDA